MILCDGFIESQWMPCCASAQFYQPGETRRVPGGYITISKHAKGPKRRKKL